MGSNFSETFILHLENLQKFIFSLSHPKATKKAFFTDSKYTNTVLQCDESFCLRNSVLWNSNTQELSRVLAQWYIVIWTHFTMAFFASNLATITASVSWVNLSNVDLRIRLIFNQERYLDFSKRPLLQHILRHQFSNISFLIILQLLPSLFKIFLQSAARSHFWMIVVIIPRFFFQTLF